MKTNFRILGMGLLFSLLPFLANAQEILTGFNHADGTTVRTREYHVQTLPFYDDFDASHIYPDSTKWITFNTYVNSGFPLNPVTHKAVTFDVLDASGKVYEYAISNPFVAEYLCSTTIRLDSVFDPEPKVLTPADSLYLSFFYQPQGNGNPPEAPDSLVLEFGVPNEYDTTWYSVWSTPGQRLSDFLLENNGNAFKQVMIPILEPRYFVSNFCFRFYNYASIVSTDQPASRGNEDNWNLDVVYLDRGRSIHNTSYPKVSFSGPAPSFLKRYSVMPYKHYRTNPTTNLIERMDFAVSNLDNMGHTLMQYYTVEQVNGQQAYVYPNDQQEPIILHVDAETRQNAPIHVGQAFSLDYDRDTTSYLIKHYLVDTDDNTIVDSLCFHQPFYNYFAYDDGIPELGYGVEPATGSFAVKFEMAQPDTLAGVQILFNRTLNDANNKYFDIVVWRDNNGKPGNVAYRLTYRKPKWETHLYQFAYYPFDQTLRISGTFYVGIMQHDGGLLNVGFDTSKDNSQYNFYNVTGSWQQSTKAGSIMLRPVIGKGYYIGVDEHPADQVSIYPNPASTSINIEGVEHGATIDLYDLSGRRVMHTLYTGELQVGHLGSGLYLMNIITHEGIRISQKITIRP